MKPHIICAHSYTREGGAWTSWQDKGRANIHLSTDTIERLKQYAFEQPASASHAMTDRIRHEKASNSQIRGQRHIDL